MGLKITVHALLGQIQDKVTKIPKYPTTIFKSLEQKLGTAHAPCTQHHQGVGKTRKPPLQPAPWTHPYPHIV